MKSMTVSQLYCYCSGQDSRCKTAQHVGTLSQGFGWYWGAKRVGAPKAELSFQWGGQRAAFPSWCLDELSGT